MKAKPMPETRFMPWRTTPWAAKCPIRVDWTPNPVTRRLVLSWPFTGHGLTIWIGPKADPCVMVTVYVKCSECGGNFLGTTDETVIVCAQH